MCQIEAEMTRQWDFFCHDMCHSKVKVARSGRFWKRNFESEHPTTGNTPVNGLPKSFKKTNRFWHCEINSHKNTVFADSLNSILSSKLWEVLRIKN